MISMYGLTRSNIALSPPIMNVSVAFSAPGFEPVQGVSRKCAFFFENASPISTLTVGEMVLQSAMMLSGANAFDQSICT